MAAVAVGRAAMEGTAAMVGATAVAAEREALAAAAEQVAGAAVVREGNEPLDPSDRQ